MKKYRIYINDNTLYITATAPELITEIEPLEVEGFYFPSFYKRLSTVSGKSYLLIDKDPQALFKSIKKSCTIIKAAGGLVASAKGRHLFIFRNKRWDLPKGKVEKGEKMKEAALREVEEECGVKIYTNGDKLCKTYHVYTLGTKIVLKKTNWYSMTVKGEPKLIPQKEEGITKASWLGKDELKPIIANTYPSIMDVLEAGELLEQRVL
ncbi:NUDIX hydrolase [Pedobacter heparinus]|uniref:NUDIX hydrolase n=1 Tax=Pedobacter heparinus (strain ATCC 13125 / DSM 2366 / CIP 104194 / JCM 7457 / NBRC 12017 / NCIMB 9290 / NRRL B-14731 / HIM 762-3) TaxID=485917 RepID=C6XTP3_PEDHD|nr:NUDIX domain-containing protein [Pedobacter heparinus]ACU03679.1 NUDIX hydrolase [Pedobacter heparinus DSM 2366]